MERPNGTPRRNDPVPAKPQAALPVSAAAADGRADVPDADRLHFDTLDGHLGYFVRRLQVHIFQDFIRTLAPFDVRPAQYSVLVLIAANPSRSQAAIGRALNIERAALAKMLHELEARGWVRRLPSVRDRRSHALYLSRDGEKALSRIKALALAHERRLERLVGTSRHRELIELLREFG